MWVDRRGLRGEPGGVLARRPRPRTLAGGLLVAAILPRGAQAWSRATHQQFAVEVCAALPPALAAEAAASRAALEAGAAAPDRAGKPGWIPPRVHTVDPARDRGLGSLGAAVEALEAWLAARARVRDRAWWFQVGRWSHLVSDLAQPLHAGRDPAERRVHGRYEQKVARGGWRPSGAADGAGEAAGDLGRLARESARQYRALLNELVQGRWREATQRGRRRLDRAHEVAVSRLEAVARGEARRAPRGPWWLGALAGLGLAWRRRRRQGRSDGSNLPPQGRGEGRRRPDRGQGEGPPGAIRG